ncbi:DUF4179 domain-containing protein [Bacillus sp. JJ1532]|uniref:DUF4179 domain-containing protein n=1 Tax=unclassified Bacillus (in: firmicutes) TaxID=185979 RepID=UPI002FFFA6B9
MRKDLLNSYIKDIEVPTEEIMMAIDQGIKQGEKYRNNKKRTTILKRGSFFSSIAASLLLVSGFVFSPVSNVLAQVPIIGGLYEKYQMPIGQELASEKLITELNELVEDNGVKMGITSIFYDGQYVGLTFKVTGENLAETIGGEKAPESGYAYEMFDRTDETTWWGGTMGAIIKDGDGYSGAMILENPKTESADSLTLPITFTHIAGVQGEWAFNLPVHKLPSKELKIVQTTSSLNNEYSLEIKELKIGQTNALLSYELLNTAGIEGEQLSFNIVDDKGKKSSLHTISDSKVIFEINRENPTRFLLVEPTYKIGNNEIHLETVKINLN